MFVVQNYFPSVGGTQIFFQNLAEKCTAVYKDEVHVFTTNSYYGPEKKYFKKAGPDKEVINNVNISRFGFIRFHLYFSGVLKKIFYKVFNSLPDFFLKYLYGPWSPSLIKAMNDSDADIVMAGTSDYLYMHYPLYRHNYKNPKPFVFQGAIHFMEDESRKVISATTLEAIKKSDCYIANTYYEKERLIKLGVDAETIAVAGSSVDMDLFKNGNRNYYRDLFKLKETDILLGYIGRIEATKNLDVLLAAFELISHSVGNIHLVIAGYTNSTYAKVIEKNIASLRKRSNINIHTVYSLSETEKVNLYHALDIFISPSVNESFGMVFLEAWCCRKPVIAMSTGAIRSVINDGIDGLLCMPCNAGTLATKTMVLVHNERLRRSMGENGYQKTEDNYTWDIIAKKYRDTLIKAKEKFDVQRRSPMD